ncbi:hypothetical protein [Pyrobaculum sp.]|uniref:hypothetical protein n=1 Tax=Pyrobaculum sp. TaxID=2004705 RepID=UPI003D1142B6
MDLLKRGLLRYVWRRCVYYPCVALHPMAPLHVVERVARRPRLRVVPRCRGNGTAEDPPYDLYKICHGYTEFRAEEKSGDWLVETAKATFLFYAGLLRLVRGSSLAPLAHALATSSLYYYGLYRCGVEAALPGFSPTELPLRRVDCFAYDPGELYDLFVNHHRAVLARGV